MKKLNSKLFSKFNEDTISTHQLSSIKGGLGNTRVTGDTDCTGDYVSPDCGDGSSSSRDSLPTDRSADSCNG